MNDDFKNKFYEIKKETDEVIATANSEIISY